MSHTGISLIIPTYNRKALVNELLSAATSQTVSYHDIIVVDDGSTDGTDELIARNYPGVRYLKTPNRGTQHARNTGIRAAETEWITICDSDDLIDTRYNEHIAQIIKDDPAVDQIYSNFRFFNDEGDQPDVLSKLPDDFFSGAIQHDSHVSKVPNLLDKILFNQFLWPSGMTIRVSALDLTGLFDTNLRNVRSEDLEFTLRTISKLNIAISRSPLVKIRKHGDNQSSDTANQLMGEVTILHKFIETTHFGYLNRCAITESINKRRNGIILNHYDRKSFNKVIQFYEQDSKARWSMKSRVKYWIAKVPSPTLQLLLWRLTKLVS